MRVLLLALVLVHLAQAGTLHTPFASLGVESDNSLALKYPAPKPASPGVSQEGVVERKEERVVEAEDDSQSPLRLNQQAPQTSDSPAAAAPLSASRRRRGLKESDNDTNVGTTNHHSTHDDSDADDDDDEAYCGCPELLGTEEAAKTKGFVSYRVATDEDVAEKLVYRVQAFGDYNLDLWWDKQNLQDGENWRDGFCSGLESASHFIPLISRASMASLRSLGEGATDNFLTELETAVDIYLDNRPHFVVPVCVGEYVRLKDGARALVKFADFDWSTFPDVKSATCSVRTIRETMQALFEIQCIPLDPDDLSCGVQRVVNRLLEVPLPVDSPHMHRALDVPPRAANRTNVTTHVNTTSRNATSAANVTGAANATAPVNTTQPNTTHANTTQPNTSHANATVGNVSVPGAVVGNASVRNDSTHTAITSAIGEFEEASGSLRSALTLRPGVLYLASNETAVDSIASACEAILDLLPVQDATPLPLEEPGPVRNATARHNATSHNTTLHHRHREVRRKRHAPQSHIVRKRHAVRD